MSTANLGQREIVHRLSAFCQSVNFQAPKDPWRPPSISGRDRTIVWNKICLKMLRIVSLKATLMVEMGSGGSASGRETDFCPSGPGSIPGLT